MKDSIVAVKSVSFAIRIINAYKYLCSEHKEYIMSKQLLRSGTAIGALVREAEHAESKADFLHKISIGLKEANETDYWLLILKETDYLNEIEYQSLKKDIEEIIRMLVSTVKTTKRNLGKKTF